MLFRDFPWRRGGLPPRLPALVTGDATPGDQGFGSRCVVAFWVESCGARSILG